MNPRELNLSPLQSGERVEDDDDEDGMREGRHDESVKGRHGKRLTHVVNMSRTVVHKEAYYKRQEMRDQYLAEHTHTTR